MATGTVLKAMKILWEGEAKGNRWDDLYEYPYSDGERKQIIARLEETVLRLRKTFPTGF